MALPQHQSYDIRFKQQVDNAERYLLPFIESAFPIRPGMRVMEIGCGEGGVLRPFATRGCSCLGVDLSANRIAKAIERMEPEITSGKAAFIAQNVYDEGFRQKHQGEFDLILLKDTIEHIPDQEKFIPYIKQFLKPDGAIFFGFPPWRMPFGGHQQICSSKLLGYLPYYHLLPKGIYHSILKAAKEPEYTITELLEIKDTGISIKRMERILKASHLNIVARRLYLFNPIYEFKFGLKPREQGAWVDRVPFIRDFVTTAGWYLVKAE